MTVKRPKETLMSGDRIRTGVGGHGALGKRVGHAAGLHRAIEPVARHGALAAVGFKGFEEPTDEENR